MIRPGEPDDLREGLDAASGGLGEALNAARARGPRLPAEVPIITMPSARWWRRKIWRIEVWTLIFTAIGAIAGALAWIGWTPWR